MAYYFRVDHRSRLLAAFSPKCASSALRNWLQMLDRQGGAQPDDPPGQPFFVTPEKAAGFREYFSVLFLRDPLRRLVSFYSHWVVRHPGVWSFADHDRRFWLDRKSFRKFLYALDHLHRNRLRFQHHLEAQMENTSGIDFDRVVLVENLHPALRDLNRRLGFSYLPPQANRTPHDPRITQSVADCPPQQLRQRGVPQARWFFDRDLLQLGEQLYATDIAAYRSHGGMTLSLDQPDPARLRGS